MDIAYKHKALLRVLDRYGAYLLHFATLSEDTSLKAEDRAHLRGYLNKWKNAKMLVGSAMYVEAIKPALFLKLACHYRKRTHDRCCCQHRKL